MYLNTSPAAPQGKPNILEYAQLKATLLPDSLVMLVPLEELDRRASEIDATHPQFREETPVVVAIERKRRARLRGLLQLSVTNSQVA
jgi:hypothetical protein